MMHIARFFLFVTYFSFIYGQSLKQLIDGGVINPEHCVQFSNDLSPDRTILINLSSAHRHAKINNLDGFNQIIEAMEDLAVQHSPRSKRKKSVPPSIDWSLFVIEVDLSHNELTNLHEESFIRLCNRYPLQRLDVSYNALKTLDQKHFVSNSGLAHLKSCCFAHNHISYIPKDFLQNALEISSLDLSHNKLPQKMVERITKIAATKPSLTTLKLNDRKHLKKQSDHLKDDDAHSQNSDGSLEISIGK